VSVYRFIRLEKAHFPVTVLCRVLEVSRSAFYAWQGRTPSKREREDIALTAKIKAIHTKNRGAYGSPRIHQELVENGEHLSRKRVARLMKEAGLSGLPPKRFKKTTDSCHNEPVAKNLLNRNFDVDVPNEAWVGDITSIWTWEGWVYLAVVIDLFSRKVVGWSAADHMRSELVEEALKRALTSRQPQSGLISHSDRGSQYASTRYQDLLDENEIVCSMSRKANCWDNAVSESFFGRLKVELIHQHAWATKHAVIREISSYIHHFYNPIRRHSANDGLSPDKFEQRHRAQRALAA